MNKRWKLLCYLFLGSFLFALFLAACGGSADPTGLKAVTQTGRWMSVVQPTRGGSLELTIIDMKSGKIQLTLTDADISQYPLTIFSVSGEYLLYRTETMWQLVEISSQSTWPVAPINMNVEFLPDDEMLIEYDKEVVSEESSQSQTLYQFWLASTKSPGQENWLPITAKGRYVFKSQAQGLPAIPVSSTSDAPAQAFCRPATVINQDTRVIVDTDGIVRVLTSDTQRSEVVNLHKLSAATTELLQTHETVQRALADQQIKKRSDYESLTEAQKAALVDTIARSGITGLVSSDGKYLLLLTVTSLDTDTYKYSLHLIDLGADTRVTLSSETDWPPAFLFSPDGSQILYESNAKGDRAWYLRSSAGGDPIRLSLQDVGTLCWY